MGERSPPLLVIRPSLLAWQWSDYVAKHRDRSNLLIHIVAVPLFQLAMLPCSTPYSAAPSASR